MSRSALFGLLLKAFHTSLASAADQFDLLKCSAPDLEALDGFLTFGWGNLDRYTKDLIRGYGLDPVLGGTEDLQQVADFQCSQEAELPEGFDLNQLGGLHWC